MELTVLCAEIRAGCTVGSVNSSVPVCQVVTALNGAAEPDSWLMAANLIAVTTYQDTGLIGVPSPVLDLRHPPRPCSWVIGLSLSRPH